MATLKPVSGNPESRVYPFITAGGLAADQRKPCEGRQLQRLGARTRLLLAVIVVALVVPTASSSGAPGDAAFGPGVWIGKAFYRGTVDQPGLFGFASAIVEFDLTVEGDEVAGGMDVEGHGESSTIAGAGDASFSGSLDLSGTASSIIASGEVNFAGTANGFPIEFGGPVSFSFIPTHASCTRVFGDLVSDAISGEGVSASAPFIAFRAMYGSQIDELLTQYEGVVFTLNDLIAHPDAYKNEDFDDLVQKAENLNARILELVPCVPLPAGRTSTAPSEFQALFRQIVAAALEQAESLSADEVLSLLAQGVRTGALVGSTPDVTALLDEFNDVLSQKLVDAVQANDLITLKDIAVGAKQAGLTQLAADAQAAIEAMGGG
jgi:hypothetical protein